MLFQNAWKFCTTIKFVQIKVFVSVHVLYDILSFIKFTVKSFIIELELVMLSVIGGRTYVHSEIWKHLCC